MIPRSTLQELLNQVADLKDQVSTLRTAVDKKEDDDDLEHYLEQIRSVSKQVWSEDPSNKGK